MTKKDATTGIKSAYELALERLESQGIERPREDSFSDTERQEIGEIKSRAEAKLAELEILHKQRLAKIGDPLARQEEERDYLRERSRIEERREQQMRRLRERA